MPGQISTRTLEHTVHPPRRPRFASPPGVPPSRARFSLCFRRSSSSRFFLLESAFMSCL